MAGFGDIFISDSISDLVGKFGSLSVKKMFQRQGAEEKLEKLSTTLGIIEGVLTDAEEQQITSLSVKNWLSNLRDVWYDLDDILDEIEARALIKKSQGVGESSSSRNTAAPEDEKAIIDRKMMKRIDAITCQLDHLSNLRKQFNLVEMSKLPGKPKYEYMKPSPLLEKHHVYGRDEEKESIIRLLLANDGMLVIPIIGMGGIGKTTLAKLVYHDERVGKCFDVKAWTCVSDDYNEVAIIKKIYEDVTRTTSDCRDLDTLHVNLKGVLADKKFLIVLDDLWNECYRAWLKLKSPLFGKPGSRIIVTTRLESVVDILGSPHVTQRVRCLRNEECLSILCHHAEVSFLENPDLEDIGTKLVEKCGGLPLAAEALGGVLRSKKKRKDWEKVLHSKIWNRKLEKEILPVLWLSYIHLPPHLKNLFAYCAIFPKDYRFDKNEIVHLWMAECLLKEGDAGESKEEIGLECFDDLHSRSFFQLYDSTYSSKTFFVMHDLMIDLAQHVAGGICHHFEVKMHNDLPHHVLKKIRHSSYKAFSHVTFDPLLNLPQSKGLRSLFNFHFHFHGRIPHTSGTILMDAIPKLHCLRVLCLCGHFSIRKLPDSLFELIHLRYLDLSNTSIVELPNSVGNLVFLEFLLLRNCCYLEKLPKSLGSLSKLRHLDNAVTIHLMCLPAEIGTLKSLQVLPRVVLNSEGGFKLKYLEDLMLLEGELSISQLENATSDEDGHGKYLISKDRLEKLKLRWSESELECSGSELEWSGSELDLQDEFNNRIPPEDVLEMLQPHRNLRELEIYSYVGSRFPSWIGEEIFRNLSQVILGRCIECLSLPPLGQLPNLECLELYHFPKVERIDEGFYGNSTTPFPKLQKLFLDTLPNLREWTGFPEVDEGISNVKFNCLGELAIAECPQLETAPQLICPSLEELEISGCSGLVSFPSFDLPPSLRELTVWNCKVLRPLKEWGLHNLSRLANFTIQGGYEEQEQLSDTKPLFPASLESLSIAGFPKLISLADVLENLNSLRQLSICHCEKMEVLPSERVLKNLSSLIIFRCPLLEEKRTEEKGEYGTKIAHIPGLEIG